MPMPPATGMPPPPPEPPRPITDGNNYKQSLLSMMAQPPAPPGAPPAPPGGPPAPPGAPPGAPAEGAADIYADSSIFKTNNWRERKTSRIGGAGDDAGTFAQGLLSEEPRASKYNKETVVSGGGLFDGGALKSKDETKKTQAIGLFDDSDDEREAKKEIERS